MAVSEEGLVVSGENCAWFAYSKQGFGGQMEQVTQWLTLPVVKAYKANYDGEVFILDRVY